MNDYEFVESLGAHHPITVSLTVAEAEQRERRGLPLPISGDAESDHAKELLRIRQERKAKVAPEAEVATPAVKAEAAGLSFLIEPTQIRLAVVPVAGGQNVVALIDEESGVAVALPLRFAAHVGNQLAKIAHVLGHDRLELRGLGSPAVGIGQLRDRLGQFLDGSSEITSVCVIGVGGDAGNSGGLPGLVPGSVKSHSSSPSVGVPGGAVCDNPKPTEGDSHQGGSPSNKAGHLL